MSYGIQIITPNTTLPVTLAEAKLHLKLDSDTTDDSLVTNLIYVAQEIVEDYCRIRLLTTVEELYLDRFPNSYDIWLNKWPISAITYLKYIDANGTTQTLSSSAYVADTNSKPGKISLNYMQYWPIAQIVDNSVWIRYSVGFGTSTSSIPYVFKQSILMIVGHMYQNREEIVTNTHIEHIPWGAKYLMDMNRYKRL